MKILAVIIIGLLSLSMFSIFTSQVKAQEYITDGINDWIGGTGLDYMDITSAGIIETDSYAVRFEMTLAGNIPKNPSPRFLGFLWGLDLDQDGIFSEFPPNSPDYADLNVRVAFDPDPAHGAVFGWHGFVDGQLGSQILYESFSITSNKVSFTLSLYSIHDPMSFFWEAGAIGSVDGSNLPPDIAPNREMPRASWGKSLQAFTSISPTIDGVIGVQEWASATKVDFTDRLLPDLLRKGRSGSMFVMNDQTNLYIAVKIEDPAATPTDFLLVHFDNNQNGIHDIGDDRVGVAGDTFIDMYDHQGGSAAAWKADVEDGGTTDGDGARTNDGSYSYYELSHPLNSADDNHDFSLEVGNNVGFLLFYASDETGNGSWPGTDAPSTWGEISFPIVQYELFIETDYMTGHKPTGSVLTYIKNYYMQYGIGVTFYVDDEIPEDPYVTDDEFWSYEALYNDIGDDKIVEGIHVFYSKWKWVLYGTVDGLGVAGYTEVPTPLLPYYSTRGGNYIFIADETTENFAFVLGVTVEQAETVVLMHEIGHSIGILNLKKIRFGWDERYDPSKTSVMAELTTTNCNAKPIRYSNAYWALKDIEYYEI